MLSFYLFLAWYVIKAASIYRGQLEFCDGYVLFIGSDKMNQWHAFSLWPFTYEMMFYEFRHFFILVRLCLYIEMNFYNLPYFYIEIIAPLNEIRMLRSRQFVYQTRMLH